MPLEDRVELDVDDALRRIDSIEEALTASATRFGVALASALDVLSTVTVGEADASAVTSSIDAAVEAADTSTIVEADAEPVTAAIDEAVAAGDSQVIVEGEADGITSAIDDAVAAADATVDVDADTSGAETAISDLGATAEDATAGVAGLGFGIGQLTALSEASTGNLAGLQSGIVATHKKAAAAAAGVTALGSAALALFHAALDSDTATRRFNAALGDMADEVENVGIEGFARNLGELAEKAGSDDEAMRLAAARIADLGKSAGASGPQIADTAKQILLLATHATVANPTLGDAGDVADRMTAAFARGGRALLPFGIALSSTAVNARASAEAGGKAAEQLTIFEKAAAGAALATEQLGGKLESGIVEGAQSTEIQLRSLREEFKNTLEELGKPLLEPVIEAIRAGQPVLLDLAQIVGQLAEAILPVFIKAIEAGGPILHALATATETVLGPLGAVLELVASIPAPFLTAVGAVVLFGTALGPLITALGVGLSAAAGLASAALGALFTPMGAVAVGVGLLATAWVNHAKAQAESNRRVEEGAKAFEDESKSMGQAIEQIAKARIPENQRDDIEKLGLSYEQVGRLATEGKRGLDTFLDGLVRSGQISPQVSAALKETGGSTSELRNNVASLGLTLADLERQNLGVVDTFRSLSAEQQKSAHDTLEEMLLHHQLTGALEAEARAALHSKDKHVDLVAIVDRIKGSSEGAAAGTDTLGQALDEEVQKAKDANDALQMLLDAQIAFLDSAIGAQEANQKFAESLATAAEKAEALAAAQRDHGASSKEAAAAQKEYDQSIQAARDDAFAAAKAAARLAEDQAGTEDPAKRAAAGQEAFRQSLITAAAQATGPTREAILGLIAVYNDHSLADKVLHITADTDQAERDLASLLRKLDAMDRHLVGVTVHGASMAGGTVVTGSEGQVRLFGEAGPEVAFIGPNTTARVLTAGQTAGLAPAAQGPTIGVNVETMNINEVAQDKEATAFAVAARLGAMATR